tara:strand:- start:1953 stop:2567 length:615 start_codon:yes stop_codon:yes gene_type:complete
MNKFIKSFLILVGLTSVLSVNSAEFESNVALSSEYIWRGLPQTNGEPAISGGFDIAGDNGLYFGTWASNVEWGDDSALELDWYAGYSNELESGITYDIGYLAYTYPGEEDLDFEEIYLGLSYSYFGLTYSAGQDDAPDNTEVSITLGESGLGLTFGDYDDLGDYMILSYDLPMTLAGLSVNFSYHDGDYDGLYDDSEFVITFSM